ncbi:MAG: hypothetical protein AAFN10_03280 [Bacteroidota bacterium]
MELSKQIKSLVVLIGLCSLFVLGCDQFYCPCESSPLVNQYNDSTLNEVLNSELGAPTAWKNFDELKLSESEGEAYRFLYLAPFGKYKKIYRLEALGSAKVLTIKTFSATYDSLGERTESEEKSTRNLSLKEWSSFQNVLSENCFWHMPVFDERRGLDGSNWLLEGFEPTPNRCQRRDYHFVYRWAPNTSSQAFLEICDEFKKLEFP